ncbi:MAG TPA: hypothetical protein VKB78_03950 [Pirellulales bacterium]|nr:hypothetical protein [Pirellulales bacterium]
MRIQFSLRTLFFVITIVALLCGIAVRWRMRQEKQAGDDRRIKKQVESGGGFRPIARELASMG